MFDQKKRAQSSKESMRSNGLQISSLEVIYLSTKQLFFKSGNAIVFHYNIEIWIEV